MLAAFIKLLDQPLIQFLLLGLAVFAVDRYMRSNEDDPRRILIDDARYAELAGIFQDNQGRIPTASEMEDLMVKWAQNEVLYREAQLMELDRGDEMIRQRLILKLRNVFFNRVAPPIPDEKTLAAWFEANRQRYDKPETFDFEQFLVKDQDAAGSAEALAAELGEGEPGGAWARLLRRYHARPFANLEIVFGAEQAARLRGSTGRDWVAVRSSAGWHLARITGRNPGVPADLAAIRTRVVEDYKAEEVQRQLVTGMQAIARRYDIRIELTAPPEAWDEQRIDEIRLAMEQVE